MPLYFIAIVAPDEVNQQVLEWKNYMLSQFKCKNALKSPAHITLIPPFNLQPALEKPLTIALEEFARQQSTFPVYLKNFAAFAPRVIYVQVEPGLPLLQLKKELEVFLLQTNRFPIKIEERPFHPHVTIASRDLKKEDFMAACQYFHGRLYEAVFEAGTISLLGHNGNRWTIVADCPFG
jgi:2'-5' RNA ligase